MASVSPTRIMSTPAPSATRADGKSYAVTITNGGPLPLRALMSGALSGARESGLDDAVVISEPPPSGAPTAPGSTQSVARGGGRFCRPPPQSPSPARADKDGVHDAARLRELRLPGRGAGPRPPRLRHPGDVGHTGVATGHRRAGAVVRLVPLAIPARARRGRRRDVRRFSALLSPRDGGRAGTGGRGGSTGRRGTPPRHNRRNRRTTRRACW